MATTATNTTTPPLPLNCSVCPKKPIFSDVSHLLTHISSKGHLAHYYKVKIRSGTDQEARHIIEDYDQWYADYNVEQLMSERMQSKDRKRPRRRVSAPVPRTKEASKPRRTTSIATFSPVKFESHDQTDTSATHFSFPPLPNPFAFVPVQPRPKKPRLFLWDTKRPASFDPIPLEPSSSPLRLMFPRPPPFAPMLHKAPTIEEEDELEEDEDNISEVTRLKGVFWPGMDLFDAATPNTRRKRNQKKNTSVAECLERQSRLVEPNEVIFTPLGTLRKSRYISGQIEYDSSPYKLDIPSPQPKRRAGRKPLADKDTNASISKKPCFDLEGLSPIKNENSRLSMAPLVGPAKKRKRGFEVFNDGKPEGRTARKPTAAQPTIKHARHPSFGNPTGMHLLTSAFQHSPPFDADGVRQGPAMPDLSNGQPQNSYFADAFAHYQPAFYGMPYYGYGYYGPPHYNYTHPGFMPLAAQQPHHHSARRPSPARDSHTRKGPPQANHDDDELQHDEDSQRMLEAFEAAQAADEDATRQVEDDRKTDGEDTASQEHDDSMTISAPNSVTKK